MQRVTPEMIVHQVRAMRSCDLSEEILLFWLAELEFRVLFELYDGDLRYLEEGYMILGQPFSDVYWTYLLSIVDLAQQNMESYKVTHAMAQKAWEAFRTSFDAEKHRSYFDHNAVRGE